MVKKDKLWQVLIHLRHPLSEAKYNQSGSMKTQQEQVKLSAQEQPFRHKTPVHCPLEHEDAAHVKGSGQVGCWIGGEEGQS